LDGGSQTDFQYGISKYDQYDLITLHPNQATIPHFPLFSNRKEAKNFSTSIETGSFETNDP
jgi:hypothetical protein